jgi:hypothetical protein
VIFEQKKDIYFSTYYPPTLIQLSHRFTGASKPAAQKSLDCCLSQFGTSVSTSSSSAKRLPPSCERLYAEKTSHHPHFFMNIHCIESFHPQKKHKRRCSSLVHSSSMVDILTTKTTLWTWSCVSYLDCHEGELRWYLVIHIEHLSHTWQVNLKKSTSSGLQHIAFTTTLPRALRQI